MLMQIFFVVTVDFLFYELKIKLNRSYDIIHIFKKDEINIKNFLLFELFHL